MEDKDVFMKIKHQNELPNILFLMCDQLQAEVFHDNSPCLTPNLDKLKSRGMQFNRAYTPNAVCSPARASLMTGLLPHNHGVLQVTHTVDDDQGNLREKYSHWAQHLVDAGYHTGYFGKWHIERSNHLDKFGWQVNGAVGTSIFNDKKAKILQNGQKQAFSVKKTVTDPPGYNIDNLLYGVTNIKPEHRSMGIITSLASDYLKDRIKQDNGPWTCFVSIPEPHDPFICGEDAFAQYSPDKVTLKSNVYDDLHNRPNIYKKASKAWKNMTDDERRIAIACYYASITEIDEQYGKLIDLLENEGELDNTLIIFTADHGELLGSHGMYCKNFSAFEEIYNIPLFISGPGIEENVRTTARVGLHDIGPTLMEWLGFETELFDAPDSRSFASVLNDKRTHENDFVTGFSEYHGGRMLLTQRVTWYKDWKFVFNGFDFDELYHLKEDPEELNNLIDDPESQSIVRDMSQRMWKKVIETGDHSLYKSHYPILRVAPYGPFVVSEF